MSDQVIVTKRGTFGRLQVTLPMAAKESIMRWARQSGMGKAEFLRVAMLMGAKQLAESVQAKKPEEGFYPLGGQTAADGITEGPALREDT